MEVYGLFKRINWGYNDTIVKAVLTDSELSSTDKLTITITPLFPNSILGIEQNTIKISYPITKKESYFTLNSCIRKYLAQFSFEDPVNFVSNINFLNSGTLDKKSSYKSGFCLFQITFEIPSARVRDYFGFMAGGIPKNLIHEDTYDLSHYYDEFIYLTPRVSGKYTVDLFDGYPLVITFLFCGKRIEATLRKQFGASYATYSTMKAGIYKELTEVERKRASSFLTIPGFFAAKKIKDINIHGGVNHFNINRQILEQKQHTTLLLHPIQLSLITKDETYPLDVVRRSPKTNCGVYLRWLNNFGGWSHFLFEDWEEKTSVKSKGRFERLESAKKSGTLIENSGMMGRQEMGIERVDVLSVKAFNLELYQKVLIDTLYDSPKIYIFTGKDIYDVNEINTGWSYYWSECYISSKKGDLTRTNKKSYSVSFDLLKPKRNSLYL